MLCDRLTDPFLYSFCYRLIRHSGSEKSALKRNFTTNVHRCLLFHDSTVPSQQFHTLSWENELFCNIFYLRHLCDTDRFPDWPIREPVSKIIHANFTISGWLTNLSPHSQPISEQSKIIGNLVINVFPCFVSVAFTSLLCFMTGSFKCLVLCD